MTLPPARRLVLDVSSLLRWTGPPVGIARVQHALAVAALRRPDAVLADYDPVANRYRTVAPAWQDVLLGWSGAIDPFQPAPPQPGLRGLIPGRQPAVAALERIRLTRSGAAAALAGLVQRGLLALRPHGFRLFDAAGARFANVPLDLALGGTLPLGPGDTVLTAGSGWSDRDPDRFAALIGRAGCRHATVCYDLIPVTHPQFYDLEIAAEFAAYWRGILPATARVVVTARCIAADLRAFCALKELAMPDIVVLPLGHDPPQAASAAALPTRLHPGRYALFVSTIEPRKGHALLLRVWRRLLAEGIPQRAEFTLVLVGRPGWMVEPVLAELAAIGGTVLHLPHADDAVREALLRHAAFCLYPSIYEGFGLPVIEAFACGRAVLASNGGALAEVVGALSPQLDPADEDAWTEALANWIEHPEARAPYEAMLRAAPPFPTWEAAAGRILDAVLA